LLVSYYRLSNTSNVWIDLSCFIITDGYFHTDLSKDQDLGYFKHNNSLLLIGKISC
jgi:hypothetical protein